LTWPSRSSSYLLALAVAAGVVDAVSYMGLGRVFTANMTGNTVLLGVGLARGSGADAARSAVALGGFCVGTVCGVALLRRKGQWPEIAARALLVEFVALAGLLAAWAAAGVDPVRYPLIVLSGIAMGAQSATVRASDVRGVNTTYMTSTLLNALARLVQRARGIRESREGPSLPAAAWAIYAVGALAGAYAERSWHATAVAIPLVVVGAVSVAAIGGRRLKRRSSHAD
jgi:uncharacterized membrane protein YoaK (UPF0700 family)